MSKKSQKFDRRNFLRGSAVLALAGQLPGYSLFAGAAQSGGEVAPADAFGENTTPIPDSGWRLWTDQEAEWRNDSIFLPEDVVLQSLPVKPPTGGWEQLNAGQGLAVELPSTVEQYFWGLQGLRPYHDEYKFETTDSEVRNGAYYGVSWWWREIEIPRSFAGKRIVLHVRGARQRAEVYLNRQLTGYSILEELPFECDLTPAARPGETNHLAIRITNPGGRLDWVDKDRITWGHETFQKSHGFGGLDRALALSAHDAIRVKDAWVLNTPDKFEVTAHAELENADAKDLDGLLRFAVIDPETRREIAHAEIPSLVKAQGTAVASVTLRCPEARLWDLNSPHLYRVQVRWTGKQAGLKATRSAAFGFRWFAPEGTGQNALFRLNGRRVRIYTAISWGYWGLNGLWPIPELSEKEVDAAKRLNLNCLNFHRNLAKEDVLAVQDRKGLLRCLEPGGGSFAVGRPNEPVTFSQRYMQAKIAGMIRAYRGHPSVVEYILQNEYGLDLKNPELERVLRSMHEADPSRSVVANDGFVSRSGQAWIEPYSDRFRTSADGGAGGWWDDHKGAPSDVWQDDQYVSSSDFLYRSADQTEIVEWGEMKGAASIDNHARLIEQIRNHGGKSYDLADHQEILAAYSKFLDAHGFRQAFPTDSALFQSIGCRAYESWGQFLENIRISDDNDYATISGWESTAIENHSGLVDNFREFKADPDAIAQSLLPVRPVAKQKHLAVELGGETSFDLYLLNDSGKPAQGKLTFSIDDPRSKRHSLGEYAIPPQHPDRFSYSIRENVSSGPLAAEGVWRTEFRLNGVPAHRREIWVVDPSPHNLRGVRVGTLGLAEEIAAQVARIPGLVVEPFTPEGQFDLVIASPPTAQARDMVGKDDVGADRRSASIPETQLPAGVVASFERGTPLFVVCTNDGQAAGAGRQLAATGAFEYSGMVGSSRASWMGTWFFVRRHPVYEGLPVDRAMSIEYQVKGSDSNGLLVEGPKVEIIAAYSRDHDRKIGAGTFAFADGTRRLIFHRITGMHRVFHQRLVSNVIALLAQRPV